MRKHYPFELLPISDGGFLVTVKNKCQEIANKCIFFVLNVNLKPFFMSYIALVVYNLGVDFVDIK